MPHATAQKGMRYISGKTYTHSVGLSCCFRQWRALSHCRFLHGYALYVSFTFLAQDLDENNWVVDFGSMKSLKAELEDLLDHKTVVAADDPMLHTFETLQMKGLVELRILPSVGLESFARHIHDMGELWLQESGYAPRVRLQKVEVREHEGNFARYEVND